MVIDILVNVKVFTLSNFICFSRLFILIGFVSYSDANYTLALTEAAVFPPRVCVCVCVCVCAECPLWIDLQTVEMFQGLRSGTSPSKSMLIKMAIFFPVKFNFEVENVWAVHRESWGGMSCFRGVCRLKEHYRVNLHQLGCKSSKTKLEISLAVTFLWLRNYSYKSQMQASVMICLLVVLKANFTLKCSSKPIRVRLLW